MIRKWLIGFLLLLCLPAVALAQTNTPKMTRDPSARLAQIKTRADNEIDRRLASLTQAASRIGVVKKLSSADKAKFALEIQTNIANMTALRAKIDADTDMETLRTDAKTIFSDFRIFAVLLPQVHELIAADVIGVTADNLSTIADKLEARITSEEDKTLLAEMRTKIADAKTQYTAVEAEISVLSPSDFPGSTAILKEARSKIKTGQLDLRTALSDARKIRVDLK